MLAEKSYSKNTRKLRRYSIQNYLYLFLDFPENMSFAHMNVRPAVMEYSASVICAYFADSHPHEMTRPAWLGEHEAVMFTAKQFKALQISGITIDEARMNVLLPAGVNVRLSEIYIEPLIRERVVRIFIDIEGYPERPSEVGAVVALGHEVLEIFQAQASVRRPTYAERYASLHLHGLPARPTSAMRRIDLMQRVMELLIFYNPTEIIANGEDIREFLPFFKEKVQNLVLPPWQFRAGHFSHIAAHLFKTGSVVRETTSVCQRQNHLHFVGPEQDPRTLGQWYKKMHGYHCALADAFELFMFKTSQVSTRNEEPDANGEG